MKASVGFVDAMKDHASRLGFAQTGVCLPTRSEHVGFLQEWLRLGYHGEMEYLARPHASARRGDLRKTLESVRSVVVLAENYYQQDGPGVPEDPGCGVVARYARGRDYHRVLKRRLQSLLGWIQEAAAVRGLAQDVQGLAYVDTGPILERELGERAGLGWFGKNTMLIHPRRGSYFFLGVLLLDLDLPPDSPFRADHCGSCRRCLEACPTGALLGRNEDGAPVMDARRCISYLTIELPGPIPEELRPALGNRVFGCDICQEVCPFNRKFAEAATEPGYAARGAGELPVGVQGLPGEDVPAETHPGTEAPSLVELMRAALDPEAWDVFTRGSAIRRTGRAGLARNVCVAMGNWLAELDDPPEEAVAVLREALEDGSELVREHAAWALGRVGAGP